MNRPKPWKDRVADLTAQEGCLYREIRKLKEEVAEAETVKHCVKTVLFELELAGKMNVGKWVAHSHNVANAAKLIADASGSLDVDKVYVCDLLHDIGRRTGIAAVRYIIIFL